MSLHDVYRLPSYTLITLNTPHGSLYSKTHYFRLEFSEMVLMYLSVGLWNLYFPMHVLISDQTSFLMQLESCFFSSVLFQIMLLTESDSKDVKLKGCSLSLSPFLLFAITANTEQVMPSRKMDRPLSFQKV